LSAFKLTNTTSNILATNPNKNNGAVGATAYFELFYCTVINPTPRRFTVSRFRHLAFRSLRISSTKTVTGNTYQEKPESLLIRYKKPSMPKNPIHQSI